VVGGGNWGMVWVGLRWERLSWAILSGYILGCWGNGPLFTMIGMRGLTGISGPMPDGCSGGDLVVSCLFHGGGAGRDPEHAMVG
jgi:hypothetical protein